MEWQPIETAPKDCDILLALSGGNSYSEMPVTVLGHFYASGMWGNCWEFDGERTIPIEGASHWMPLPAPPERE